MLVHNNEPECYPKKNWDATFKASVTVGHYSLFICYGVCPCLLVMVRYLSLFTCNGQVFTCNGKVFVLIYL